MALKRQFLSIMMIVFIALAGVVFILGAYERHDDDQFTTKVIVLEAKNMAFNKTNPTLILRVGEPVKFIIKNEDRGMLHDFVIEELEVTTSKPLKYGQSEEIVFTPTQKGEYDYFCSYHSVMMRGKVIILDTI